VSHKTKVQRTKAVKHTKIRSILDFMTDITDV